MRTQEEVERALSICSKIAGRSDFQSSVRETAAIQASALAWFLGMDEGEKFGALLASIGPILDAMLESERLAKVAHPN